MNKMQEEMGKKWGAGEKDDYRRGKTNRHKHMEIDRLQESEIRAAAEDTPKNKATASDGVNPKQIAMLDSTGIQALAVM